MCLTEIFSAITGRDDRNVEVALEPAAPTFDDAAQAETAQRKRRAGAVGREQTILSSLRIEKEAASEDARKRKLGS